MNVASTSRLSVWPYSAASAGHKHGNLPAWIRVGFPCPANAVHFLVYCEVFKPKLIFQFMGHCDA